MDGANTERGETNADARPVAGARALSALPARYSSACSSAHPIEWLASNERIRENAEEGNSNRMSATRARAPADVNQVETEEEDALLKLRRR